MTHPPHKLHLLDQAEVWAPVRGYEGLYEVSNTGKVRSIRKGDGFEMRQTLENTGYFTVGLFKDRVRRTTGVHVMVAEAFIGERPKGYHVCHADGVRTNNAAHNLIIGTPKLNASHKVLHGTAQRGAKHPRARFTDDDIRAIRARYVHRCKVNGATAIAKDYGVARTTVQFIVYGETWPGIGEPCNQPRRSRHRAVAA